MQTRWVKKALVEENKKRSAWTASKEARRRENSGKAMQDAVPATGTFGLEKSISQEEGSNHLCLGLFSYRSELHLPVQS
jgi:hypothetical protein